MLTVLLTLLNAMTISALGLQLIQPTLPAESNSIATLQAAANASPLFNSSSNIRQQWDGTIELPLNELNISLSSSSSAGPPQLRNDTYISMFNIPAGPRPKPGPGPRPAPDLPPLPSGWSVMCKSRLGTGISAQSCLDAWTLLPPIERIMNFGPRSAASNYDVGLPKRYLSCMLRHPLALRPCLCSLC